MSFHPVLVQKFGGTSVSTAERRSQVIGHVRQARGAGYQVALVVSAMGRRGDPYATDTLLDLLRLDGAGAVDPRDYDLMFTCGEAIAVAVVSHALKRAGIDSAGLTAAQARIYTDGHHVESEIVRVDPSRLRELLDQGKVPVVTGGQGVVPGTLDYTTLGRGGSDTSAVAVGVALGADRVEIFTDVEGVAAADPRVVPGASLLQAISYRAMLEMARFGAKVMHPRSVAAGCRAGLPLVVRSTFSDAPGTLIHDGPDAAPIVGLAWLRGMETVTLPGGAMNNEGREAWEARRLVMTVADAEASTLVAGATADKRQELAEAFREAGVTPLKRLGSCAWLSVVGEEAALRAALPGLLALLQQEAGEVHARELTPSRATFVIPDPA
ncbi:MAG: aspartate kinase, partial [Acidobacteria bacterium]